MESLHQNLATLAEGRVFPQSQSTVLLAFVKLKSKYCERIARIYGMVS